MVNIFMKNIKEIERFSIRHPIRTIKKRMNLRKFCKNIRYGSPSFGVLWNFADFIKYAEQIYFIRNSVDSTLYSSYDYKPGENGFKITTKEISITCKLFSDTQKVGIDIDYRQGSKLRGNYTFINNKWEKEPDEYDEFLIERIIYIINTHILLLLNKCINKKFHTDGREDLGIGDNYHIPYL